MDNIRYYLSFDCATKTLAYVLLRINFCYNKNDLNQLRNLLTLIEQNNNNKTINDKMITMLNKIDTDTKNSIIIISADCVDLFPGRCDKNITTVERIKTLADYINSTIFPLILDIPKEQIDVFVEFQMSYNTKSKIISIALLSLFNQYELYIVHPTLKNKMFITEEGKFTNFIKKYKNTYTANKKHALYNFKEYERIFNQNVDICDDLKGHIADAFMQVLGYLFSKKN